MPDAIGAAIPFVPTGPSGDETRRRLAGKSPTEVAREFEAVLLAQVISAMRKTVPDSGMLEASANRKMLDGAFDQEVARSLAAKGGLGIAEQLVRQIERQHPDGAADAATGAAHRAPSIATTGRALSPATIAAAGTRSLAAARPGSLADPSAGLLARPETAAPEGAVTPVAGEITSHFGMRSDPFTGAPRFHGGVDVAAPRGTAIRAVADGEVVFSGWRRGGEGRVVDVRHAGGLVTSYAHAERTLVRVGQHVGAGDVVATVGASGRASGPHLHFAASRDGQVVDPSALLDRDGSHVQTAALAPGAT